MNILFIDDEDVMLQLYRSLGHFEPEFKSIYTAHNVLDALILLEHAALNIDIICSDITMPDINGIKGYDIITKKYPAFVDKYLFITGNADEYNNKRVLRKPVSMDELIIAIKELG